MQRHPVEEKQTVSTRSVATQLAKCAIFVVLMIVAAYIKIPFFPVPLTFQTVVAVFAGLILGPWYGAASVGVYVLMGLLGLPVFTSGGGFLYVVNLTFGYLLGFIAAALVAGLVGGRERLSLRRALVAALCGFFVNYLIGVPYFACIWHFYNHNAGLGGALITYNVLYLPKDFVLCILAALLAWRLKPSLVRFR